MCSKHTDNYGNFGSFFWHYSPKPSLPKLVRSNKNTKMEKTLESCGGVTCHIYFLFALLTTLTINSDLFLVAVNDAQIIVFFKITGVIFFVSDE